MVRQDFTRIFSATSPTQFLGCSLNLPPSLEIGVASTSTSLLPVKKVVVHLPHSLFGVARSLSLSLASRTPLPLSPSPSAGSLLASVCLTLSHALSQLGGSLFPERIERAPAPGTRPPYYIYLFQRTRYSFLLASPSSFLSPLSLSSSRDSHFRLESLVQMLWWFGRYRRPGAGGRKKRTKAATLRERDATQAAGRDL